MHRKPLVNMLDLPNIGYIIPGVGAGFLRACEGQVGIFDSLITNPYVSSETRHRALKEIYTKIL